MTDKLVCRSPIDQEIIVERNYADTAQIRAALQRGQRAQLDWQRLPLPERQSLLRQLVRNVEQQRSAFADEITQQMGRPRRYSENEVRGFVQRAEHMIDIAEASLKDIVPEPIPGFTRFMRREPLGMIFIIAPWNYPMLTTVNSLVPALLAGNSVLLKHSAQTPLIGERLLQCAVDVLPEGLFQVLHLNHASTELMLKTAEINGVCFTGSVSGGVAVELACAGRFLTVGLELGGCDPAYIRADADLDSAVESVVDGALFNSGQSCCGIQRIYVHRSRYDEVLQRATAILRRQQLDDPRLAATTLGPVVRLSTAQETRSALTEALQSGARDLCPPEHFARESEQSNYMAPRLLADCNHQMRLMREEFFAPVAGIQPVDSDAQALQQMNDSQYGLTAALYTRDESAALKLGTALQTGTVFMNRCDVLDPALAWTGVKQTGRGITLSSLGFDQLTRIKSFHFKTE